MTEHKELNISQLGWVAGVLDLKGRIAKKNNQKRATPQYVLMVDSKETRVVKRLCDLTGTNSEYKREQRVQEWMRRPCAEHCPDKHTHISQYEQKMPATYRWQATGAAAAVILHNVMPFVETKDRFEEVFTDLVKNAALKGQGSGATVAALNRMHRLGWKMPDQFQDSIIRDPEN